MSIIELLGATWGFQRTASRQGRLGHHQHRCAGVEALLPEVARRAAEAAATSSRAAMPQNMRHGPIWFHPRLKRHRPSAS